MLGKQPHCSTDYSRVSEQERVWALLYVRRLPLYVLERFLGLHSWAATVFGAILCMLYAPETLARSLDDVDAVWEERVRKTKAVFTLCAPGIAGGQPTLRRDAENPMELRAVN